MMFLRMHQCPRRNVEDKCLRFAMSGTYHAGEKAMDSIAVGERVEIVATDAGLHAMLLPGVIRREIN